jgi:ribose/xylose/arabinose/galactoside ABC-type transport system permease subunit
MTLIIIAGKIDLSVASILGLTSVMMGITWSAGLPRWLVSYSLPGFRALRRQCRRF